MIRYFVSYAYGDGNAIGFGWTQISLALPIRSGEDIKFVQTKLEAEGFHRVMVINWQRFENAAEQTGGQS